MKERLDKLLTVKSIVTVILTLVFAGMSIKGVVTGEQFLMIFTSVMAFLFLKKKKKE